MAEDRTKNFDSVAFGQKQCCATDIVDEFVRESHNGVRVDWEGLRRLKLKMEAEGKKAEYSRKLSFLFRYLTNLGILTTDLPGSYGVFTRVSNICLNPKRNGKTVYYFTREEMAIDFVKSWFGPKSSGNVYVSHNKYFVV